MSFLFVRCLRNVDDDDAAECLMNIQSVVGFSAQDEWELRSEFQAWTLKFLSLSRARRPGFSL